jgi:hypothetical protein
MARRTLHWDGELVCFQGRGLAEASSRRRVEVDAESAKSLHARALELIRSAEPRAAAEDVQTHSATVEDGSALGGGLRVRFTWIAKDRESGVLLTLDSLWAPGP